MGDVVDGDNSLPSSTLSVVLNKSGLLATTNLNQSSTVSAPSTGNSTESAASEASSETPQRQRRRPKDEAGVLDFIGTGPAVKTLFSIPIAEQSVCVAVHNIDGTLLIDEVVPEDDEGGEYHHHSSHQNTTPVTESLPPSIQSLALALSPSSGSENNNSKQQEALTVLSQMIQKVKDTENKSDDETAEESENARSLVFPPLNPSPVREYVEWKFQDMNLLVGSDALIVRPETGDASGVIVRVEEVQKLRRLAEREQQRQSIEEEKRPDISQTPQRSYADALMQPEKPLLTDDASSDTDSKDSSASNPLNLDQVQLQTCIVPSSGPLGGWLKSKPAPPSVTVDPSSGPAAPATPTDAALSSPKCIVLDAYLDNLMTNVPQLALCLQEKGLIQSVKLLHRDQIPAMMIHPSTLDTSKPVETIQSPSSSASAMPDLFSPEIMEMNATALLRFLKANCTTNNTTYLLRTNVSATEGNNIQLYDISSISQQRQKKWIWWLATMSYRFALRLRQLESHDVLPMRQRTFRDRQRNLLQTTLDLLQDLRDMDGNAHESLVASVREHMADTFLGETALSSDQSNESPKTGDAGKTDSSTPQSASPPSVMGYTPPKLSPAATVNVPAAPKTPGNKRSTHSQAPTSSGHPRNAQPQHQPYSSITTDALNKAQDHLILGIKALWPIVETQLKLKEPNKSAQRRRKRGEAASAPFFDPNLTPSFAIQQIFGLNYKAVNVTLRLAEHYLRQYSSSSAMQSLRHAARRMADSISLLEYLPSPQQWIPRLRLQYTWLWEHCGHFARSFASDDLWRERGHSSGDDVLYVLRDVESAFGSNSLPYDFSNLPCPLRSRTRGLVSLQSLSALYSPHLGELKRSKQAEPPIWEETRMMLSNQGLLQRDKRQVLVAACISYHRAIIAFKEITEFSDDETDESSGLLNLLRQRLGDACNETGKVLLASLRAFLTKDSTDSSGLADVLLDSAQFWFLEGLDAFEISGDPCNIALLRCNLCQCCKLRANNSFSSQATTDASHAEVCLEKAANHLQAAHERLGTRETDPMTWDMVSNELASTFLVLAVRRRQSLLGGGTTPVVMEALRLSPGKERSIIEPFEKALAIYQQSGNFHQVAAVQYQLALTNSKVWTCQRDEGKTREKLLAAFTQYQNAFAYFSNHLGGNEPSFVVLCLDIASLYAAVSGEECLVHALTRCLDTCDAFSPEAIKGATGGGKSSEWLEKMETLASSVDDRVFQLLRSMVKLNGDRWKALYRAGLAAKTARPEEAVGEKYVSLPPASRSLWSLHQVLAILHEKFHASAETESRE